MSSAVLFAQQLVLQNINERQTFREDESKTEGFRRPLPNTNTYNQNLLVMDIPNEGEDQPLLEIEKIRINHGK